MSAERLPARLAAPLRFRIDAAYRAAQPVETQTALQKQGDALEGSGAVRLLRVVQGSLVNEEQLPQAFRQAEQLLPALRQEAPQLVPRLASCFYWAIVTHGQPEDMGRYRRVFGEPSEDLQFDRLQALVNEHIVQLQEAHTHWQHYEKWVAAHPERWPGGAGQPRPRPGMGTHGAQCGQHPRRQGAGHPAAVPAQPSGPSEAAETAGREVFRAQRGVAPDRLQSYETLLRFYQEKNEDRKAEKVARRLLERFPDHVPTLVALSDLQMQHHAHAEALALAQQALKLNPLDRTLRAKVHTARLFNARAHAEAGRFDEARAEYRTALALADGANNGPVLCKWAACEFKAGDLARAEELLQQATQESGNRLAVAFSMLIETIRLKLPRQLKQRFDQEFNAGLAEPPTAAGAVNLVDTAAAHRLAGITYVGQKTHEKKVLAYVEKARNAEFTEDQLEKLCGALLGLRALPAARKFTQLGQERFPNNPYFPFFEAESYLVAGPDRCPPGKCCPCCSGPASWPPGCPQIPARKSWSRTSANGRA